MAVAPDTFRRLVVPFLMGQRRDGLCRVCEIDPDEWEVVDVPAWAAREVRDPNEQMRRMGVIYARLAEKVCAIAAEGAVPVSVAGDCVSSLGLLAGLERAGRVPQRVLWLDAHGDFHSWATTPTKYVGGMALALFVGRGDRRGGARDAAAGLRHAIGVGAYPEERIILSDARDLDPGEVEAVRASNMTRCPVAEVCRHLVPGQSLYVHWDTDVLDAACEAPALKYHVARGPSLAQIGELFRSLRKERIVAVSVSAWHEERDSDNRTATACLQLLRELVAGTDR